MNRYSDILAEYSRIGRLRHMPDGDIPAGMIDLSGNDYLGIGAKGRMAELFLKRSRTYILFFFRSISFIAIGTETICGFGKYVVCSVR